MRSDNQVKLIRVKPVRVKPSRLIACGLLIVVAVIAGGCSRGEKSSSTQYCDKLKELQSVNLSGTDASNAAELAAVNTGLSELISVAPAEIVDDLETIQVALAALAQAMEQMQSDPTQAQTAIDSLESQEAEIKAAAERVNQYSEDSCGVGFTS